MKCLIHALTLWHQKGGYLCIRKCRTIPFLPHFLWVPAIGECEHLTTDDEGRNKWLELWYAVTGQKYIKKYNDEDEK